MIEKYYFTPKKSLCFNSEFTCHKYYFLEKLHAQGFITNDTVIWQDFENKHSFPWEWQILTSKPMRKKKHHFFFTLLVVAEYIQWYNWVYPPPSMGRI